MPNDAFLVFPILLFSSSDTLPLSSLVDYSASYCLLNISEDILAYIIIEPNN
jgi:hypothetical protein